MLAKRRQPRHDMLLLFFRFFIINYRCNKDMFMQLAQFIFIWLTFECKTHVATASIHNLHKNFKEFLQIADSRERRKATFSNGLTQFIKTKKLAKK